MAGAGEPLALVWARRSAKKWREDGGRVGAEVAGDFERLVVLLENEREQARDRMGAPHDLPTFTVEVARTASLVADALEARAVVLVVLNAKDGNTGVVYEAAGMNVDLPGMFRDLGRASRPDRGKSTSDRYTPIIDTWEPGE